MTFTERCHQHYVATDRWMKHHPWTIVGTVIGMAALTIAFPQVGFYLLGAMLLLMYPYTFVMMIGDGIYKSRTKWYDKHRCEKCGHFVEPKDD